MYIRSYTHTHTQMPAHSPADARAHTPPPPPAQVGLRAVPKARPAPPRKGRGAGKRSAPRPTAHAQDSLCSREAPSLTGQRKRHKDVLTGQNVRGGEGARDDTESHCADPIALPRPPSPSLAFPGGFPNTCCPQRVFLRSRERTFAGSWTRESALCCCSHCTGPVFGRRLMLSMPHASL